MSGSGINAMVAIKLLVQLIIELGTNEMLVCGPPGWPLSGQWHEEHPPLSKLGRGMTIFDNMVIMDTLCKDL